MEETFPIKELRPSEERYFPVALSMSTGSAWPATTYWKNEAGEEFAKDVVLGE